MAHAVQHFVDRDHLRSHSRWHAQWQVRADDGVSLIPGITSFGLDGAVRAIPPSTTLALGLAPYLSWVAIDTISLSVPATIMQSIGLGLFEYEIKLVSIDASDLIVGQIELRLSVTR